MNFPQFWARGVAGDFIAWRWSFTNLAEAQALADEAAQKVKSRILGGDRPRPHWGYYPNRPFREQILREIKDSAGETAAVITRNSYGCQVLNTARAMFVDIDLVEQCEKDSAPGSGFFARLFRKTRPLPSPGLEAEAIAKVENWTHENPNWSWRVYRTRAGLRLLATQGLVDPESPLANEIFEALGADPLYRKLCQSQKCYRARLTPKPWRCGIRSKPMRWPWLNEKHEKAFQWWEAKYRSACADRATCEIVRTIGDSKIHPEVQPIIQLHDQETRADSKLDLA
jgi:hypothetical protein